MSRDSSFSSPPLFFTKTFFVSYIIVMSLFGPTGMSVCLAWIMDGFKYCFHGIYSSLFYFENIILDFSFMVVMYPKYDI